MRNSRSQGMPRHRRCSWTPGETAGHIATRRGGESTGVGGKDDEPIGDALGERSKGLAFSASMAADLALVED